MPARNRNREAAKAKRRAEFEAEGRKPKSGKRSKAKTKSGKRKRKGGADAGPMADPSATEDAETRFIQPYKATKTYVCPGCNRDIPPGMGHLVAVPPDAPDLRRHWHRGCWVNRHTRF